MQDVPSCNAQSMRPQLSLCCAQITRIELALANATLVNLTAASHPHLWKAAVVRAFCDTTGVQAQPELHICHVHICVQAVPMLVHQSCCWCMQVGPLPDIDLS